jgi:hypothetical protein
MRAELYLYQLDKPERALEEYQKIADAMPGTPYAGKALNARGWVLDRRFHRQAAAESLYWKVVHEYPATEAQIAARDFLEALGETVPDSLIRYPEKPVVVRDSVALTPPGATPGLGAAGDGLFAPRDSSGFFPPGIRSPRGPRGTIFPPGDPRRIGGLAGADSAAFLNPFAPVDSSRLNAPVAPPDTVRSPGSAPADTSRAPSGAPPDSSKSGKP